MLKLGSGKGCSAHAATGEFVRQLGRFGRKATRIANEEAMLLETDNACDAHGSTDTANQAGTPLLN